MITDRYTMTCDICSWSRKDVAGGDIQRVGQTHSKEKPGHQSLFTEDLPKKPVVGDKVRICEELIKAASKAYDAVKPIVRIVQEFDRRAYGEIVYKIDGPPHLARPNQVELAWRNDAERRRGLAAWEAKTKAAAA